MFGARVRGEDEGLGCGVVMSNGSVSTAVVR